VFAQLLIKGTNQGIHGFLVPIRNKQVQCGAADHTRPCAGWAGLLVAFVPVLFMVMGHLPPGCSPRAAWCDCTMNRVSSATCLHTFPLCADAFVPSLPLPPSPAGPCRTCAPAVVCASRIWGTRWAATGWIMANCGLIVSLAVGETCAALAGLDPVRCCSSYVEPVSTSALYPGRATV
jgi:hypothetical protein